MPKITEQGRARTAGGYTHGARHIYQVRAGGVESDDIERVSAPDMVTAANLYARRRYHSSVITAQRTTGQVGMSGYFMAYRPYSGGLTSVGSPFHVMED